MKKKILLVTLIVCVLAMTIASTTIAYFTDTESAKNTFTMGDVDIKLFEYDNSGALVDTANATERTLAYTNKYPGETFKKHPTIQNVANDAAYVAAIITLGSGAGASVNTQFANNDALKAFLSGGALNAASDDYDIKIVRDTTVDTITIYIIATAPVAKDGTVVLFEDIVIPAKWDKAEMTKFAAMTIDIQAYAVQTSGFNSAEAAIKAAFSTANGDGYNSNAAFDSYFN